MRNLTPALFITLVLICANALVTGSASAQKFGKITEQEWNLQAPDDYPEANAVVIFDKAEIFVTVDGIEINYHKRIKILTQAGADEVGDQSIWYYKKGDKIKRLKAHTMTPDGKKHKVEKKSMFVKESGSWREKTLAFPVVEAGTIIELKYSHISNRFRSLKPWYFQGRVYTLHSEVSVEIAPGFFYDVTYNNIPYSDRRPKIEERRSTAHALVSGVVIKKFSWDMNNLPPIKDEPYMCAENDYRSNLMFQLLKYDYRNSYVEIAGSWDKLGDEFDDLIKEYCNKKKEIKKLAKEITKSITDQREQSLALYDFVSQQYKTTDEYISRYYAHKKIEGLLTEKTGSPEGKNILLAKMHQALEISCWPVLISRRSHSRLDPQNPNLSQFDYLFTIVEFEDGWEFLDASDRFSPYGILPPDCLTDGGLLIDGKKSQLIKLTTKPATSYRLDITNLYISDDGQATCSTKCLFTGYTAALYAQRYEKKEEEEFIEDYFIDRLGIACETGDYKCGLDSNYNFEMTLDFTSDDLVEQLDNNLIIQPVSFVYRSNPFKSKKRFFPVDFNYPFTYHNIVNIFLDASSADVTLPVDIDISIDGATFVRQSTVTDTMLTIAIKLDITERYVAIEIGVGGVEPYEAKLTQKRGFGDCKDMSTLLISKLRNSGLKAYSVSVRTRGRGPLDPDFPSPWFNHAITVAIAGPDTLWMDPTCSDCCFGQLPSGDEDIDVLVTTDDGGELWHIPPSQPGDNLTIRSTQIHIPANLRPVVTTELSATGHNAIFLRGNLARMSDESERKEFIKKRFRGLGKKFTIKKYEVENITEICEPLILRITGQFKKEARNINGTIYFDPFIYNKLSLYEREDLKDREFSLNLGHPWLDLDSIVITWDSTVLIDSIILPTGDSTITSFHSFSMATTNKVDTIFVTVSKSCNDYILPVEEFSAYESYLARVKKLTKQHLKLVLKNN